MINLKLRFKNKTTLLSLLGCIIAFVYQLLGFFDVVPAISEDTIMQFIGIALNMLATLGVIVDPTTKGIADSDRAMTYTEPKGDAE